MSRKKPSNEEIVDAIKQAMDPYGVSIIRFDEDFRYRVQLRLKTVARFARDWMFDALTDPAQTELVMLHSHDTKYVARVVRTPSGEFSYYGDLAENTSGLFLYLDRNGRSVGIPDVAVRNTNWIITRSALDSMIAELRKQESEKKAQRAQEWDAENAETEQIIGTELSLIRGMFAAAGITPNDRTLQAWAQRVDKEDGGTARRGRTMIELNAKQLVLLSKWLMDQGVEPVGPERKTS